VKILFIHNNYASNNSGEEYAAESLKEILEANGHQVQWFRRFSDIIENSLVKKIQAFFLAIYNPSAVRELKLLLDSFQPDIVQVQNLYPFISPGIISAIKRRNIPLVMRCPNYRLFCPTGLHLDGNSQICERCLSGTRELNCIIKNCENDVPKSIGYALRNYLARTFWHVTSAMDAYIVQSAFQKQKFIDNGIAPEKLFILPGLIPKINTLKPSLKPQYVSFIGRVSEEKGIKEFINAASYLPNVPFVVAGSIPDKLAYLQHNSPKNVEWKGFISGKQLDDLYKASKIIVVPSKWYEGFPNVITQAMKHGKAVITSNLGAMADIIDHNETGLLVTPGDVLELTKAIKDLLSDEEKRNLLGNNAKKKADNNYNSTKVYEELSKLYDSLLKEKIRKSRKMLAILHYPPPVHGAAMVGKFIMDSKSINSKFKINYINLGTSIKVDEIGYGSWLKVNRYFKILSNTLKQLYKEKPKLVYITLTASGPGFFKDAIVVFFAQLFGKKVVVHFHNKGVLRRQDKWLDNIFYTQVFKRTEVILLSEYLYQDVERYVLKENVHICPNGIPITENPLELEKNDKKETQLLFLSNLIEAKGVYILLDACQVLMKVGMKFHCTFIGNTGDISLAEFDKKVDDLGIESCVSYEGPKYGLEKEKAYRESDIFIFPTFYSNECFPLVLLEASQFSLPMVSTFEGGIPDIVKNNSTGYLVKKKDSLELAKKIELLIENPELRKTMGANGRENFNKHFTLGRFEEHFGQILEKIFI
tara:strand:+ start:1919 stop:4195 length:2277 start_codon:yes stop_codon:yes gene_type:complete